MASSRNQKELLWAWKSWRDTVGRQLRPTFEQYVSLSNKAAQYNGKQAAQSIHARGNNEAESAEGSGNCRMGCGQRQGMKEPETGPCN